MTDQTSEPAPKKRGRPAKKPFSISNSVKPSSAHVTMPKSLDPTITPTFEHQDKLQETINTLKHGKFQLEKDNLRLADELRDLRAKNAAMHSALNRLGVGNAAAE